MTSPQSPNLTILSNNNNKLILSSDDDHFAEEILGYSQE